jgi:hypothetical protein
LLYKMPVSGGFVEASYASRGWKRPKKRLCVTGPRVVLIGQLCLTFEIKGTFRNIWSP